MSRKSPLHCDDSYMAVKKAVTGNSTQYCE
jgi:hypothetical protein